MSCVPIEGAIHGSLLGLGLCLRRFAHSYVGLHAVLDWCCQAVAAYLQAAYGAPHGQPFFPLSCCPIMQGIHSVQLLHLGLVVLSAASCCNPPPPSVEYTCMASRA